MLAIAIAALGPDGEWLASAIVARITGGAKSIDAALGLCRRGGVQIGRENQNEMRNRLLRDFVDRFMQDLPPKKRAAALVDELRRFETDVWPRLSARSVCPPELRGTRRGALFQLMKTGPMPASEKQLARLIFGHSIAV